ncbi:ral GTPase-activating protein subunit beta-like isoform X2 [Dreissena polymorpha]|uniref:ral GTPase-activating protein subunit beta-like isoform X2 n=1 Tax=Dreissena polymorpha TaxID=45954 RepID=UPI002263F131|nr:ral GTPase-activating protein subunit beta-like isoform X2 [Dreissena polymorpha]
MYSDWTSLRDEIQFNKANLSVLNKFPEAVGKDVACSVVKHIATNLSISNSCEPSNLVTDAEVKWTMEVLCYGLGLPLDQIDTIKDCVSVYCEWLSALTSPKLPVPKPITDEPNPYAQMMLHHLLNLFVPRVGAVADLVKRQALLCHRVLRTIESVAKESALLSRDTWETLLKFLLAANNSLLSPPTEKEDTGLSSYDIGDHLCERVLSVLFELWLLACQKCFPSPSLWKTFRKMCIYWRHHEALITQWHRVNHALTARLLKFMYGPDYPELVISENDEGGLLVPVEMSNDCIAQSWFRFLHITQNPVDLAKPELISQTPMFLKLALESEDVIDPRQHECLLKLPQIFYKAMRGISIMVNAFLGISQDVKEENILTSMSFISSGLSSRQSTTLGPSTPPGQRKLGRPWVPLPAPLTQRVKSNTTISSKTSVPMPQCLPGLLSLDSRPPLAPNRPKCNSILHLFGAWLFDAALANVKILPVHRNEGQTYRRTNSLIDQSRPTSLSIDTSPEKKSMSDNTYESGRAEACGTLCRLFCAHKTGEDILPAYYSRFYFALCYGLQVDDNISGPVLSNILFNSCDLLRVDLAGVQILVPHILNALELVLKDQTPKFRLCELLPSVELRKACVHLLLSMLCLPLHFRDLEIKDILTPEATPEHSVSFISLKQRITDLLLWALQIENDNTNTQMLLGGLMLLVQDMALCEEAEQTTIQPQHDTSDHQVHADTSEDSVASNQSSESSYAESGYHRLPAHSNENDTAYGLFGQATSLVCNRLMASWKQELSTALAAMELLSGLAKVKIAPANMLMCKRTVKWICDFIVYQCSRPAQFHSKDLHSMIVAAFKCLTLWLVEHSRLLYDKECLHNVLEVVELGISGSKSQRQTPNTESVSMRLDKDSKSVYMQNKASDPPKFKGDKDFQPASMRVKDAAEAVLTCIIDQVGAFPPPCGPESLFSLLDEKSLLKYAKGTGLPENGSPFRYFVLENSIIIGLLEQPLGNYEDPLPTVTALIRGPFGRHAWTMQLRHSPRTGHRLSSSKSLLSDPGRPLPMDTLGVKHGVKHRHFPDSVDKVQQTMADKSIPSLDSLVTDTKTQSELEKLRHLIEQQTQYEVNISRRNQVEDARRPFPNQATECKPPKMCQEFQTARLFLSHYGFLSLEALKEPSNSSLPPSLVMLDTSNSNLFSDLELLDSIPSRDSDTVHVFYVKAGQKLPQSIVENMSSRQTVQPQFIEFLHSLGWPVDIGKHAGWTGHVSTSWRIMDQEDASEVYPRGTGGSVYDGRQQVLYWADVMSEIAFVVPSSESYNRYLADPNGEKSPQLSRSSVILTKPRSLTFESQDKLRVDREPTGSLSDVPMMRSRRGRQTNLMGPDTKVFVVWLESYEDHENFPVGELLGATRTGLEQYTTSVSMPLPRQPEKDVFIIFIHALQNGLFRIHMQGQTGKLTMAIPLVHGMVVSRRCLGNLVRQTAINICKRKRLESELYQPPHVRRKQKIQDVLKNYNMKMEAPDFYTALFQDVGKE